MPSQTNEIRTHLMREIQKGAPAIVRAASETFGVSRQAINRHLQALVAEDLVVASGSTRDRRYALRNLVAERMTIGLSAGLQEDRVWREQVRPLLGEIGENALRISQYGFTEMLNNAIDHSEGLQVVIEVSRTAINLRLSLADDGVGIFRKLQQRLQLEDERQAILELVKGKLTTDPARHSGEGIFFTSRVFDHFSLRSGALIFSYTPDSGDWLVEDVTTAPMAGTRVEMSLDVATDRTLKAVFDQYASGLPDYGFARTQIPVFLARYGDENLVSRSQAKRLLTRLERFREIVFDFQGVSMIGQAFADEIFRVYQAEHPDAHLTWTNAGPDVEPMIQRARGNSGRPAPK